MIDLFRKLLATLLKFLRSFLAENPKLHALLYDMSNKEEFGNLYEHEKMLADAVRMECYRKAIQKQIGPDDVVLDLGTGTGILSFLAAAKKAKKVYAIDHSDFIDIARKIAAHNKIENIEFFQSNSRNFNPDVEFDVIIHEQIGDYLFNENMIQNILDLKTRLLKPEGRIMPGRFELFLEPTNLAEPFKTPFIWENQLYGIDFSFLKDHSEALEAFKPQDYKQIWLKPGAVKQFLCEISPILTFDLNTLQSEKEIAHSLEISRQVVKPGSFDGFCLFFKVIFDAELSIDTSPLATNTHWGNCFFRIESRQCSSGEAIHFTFTMQDFLNIKTWEVFIR